jgi:hypothetical protein
MWPPPSRPHAEVCENLVGGGFIEDRGKDVDLFVEGEKACPFPGRQIPMSSANACLASIEQPRVIGVSAHAAVHNLQVVHNYKITLCPDVFEDAQFLPD